MNIGFTDRTKPGSCTHSRILSVSSAGLDRGICEACGHVSVNFTANMVGEISRTAFSRDADERPAGVSPTDVTTRHLATAPA